MNTISSKTDDSALAKLVDDVDARGGAGLRKAKQYSIESLRKSGFSEQEIVQLLNLKP